MTHQVTEDLLWKRGRVPRGCSWRWWGSGRRPDWWWSQACLRHSRWKKGNAERGDWFWPPRVGCWWEPGATTAHSSPCILPGHWGASGVPMFSWHKALLVLFPLPGLLSIHPGTGCSDPTDLLLKRLGPRQGQSCEDPVHVWQRQWVPNNWKRKQWTLATGEQSEASWGLLPVFLQISWGVNMVSLLSSRIL